MLDLIYKFRALYLFDPIIVMDASPKNFSSKNTLQLNLFASLLSDLSIKLPNTLTKIELEANENFLQQNGIKPCFTLSSVETKPTEDPKYMESNCYSSNFINKSQNCNRQRKQRTQSNSSFKCQKSKRIIIPQDWLDSGWIFKLNQKIFKLQKNCLEKIKLAGQFNHANNRFKKSKILLKFSQILLTTYSKCKLQAFLKIKNTPKIHNHPAQSQQFCKSAMQQSSLQILQLESLYQIKLQNKFQHQSPFNTNRSNDFEHKSQNTYSKIDESLSGLILNHNKLNLKIQNENPNEQKELLNSNQRIQKQPFQFPIEGKIYTSSNMKYGSEFQKIRPVTMQLERPIRASSAEIKITYKGNQQKLNVLNAQQYHKNAKWVHPNSQKANIYKSIASVRKNYLIQRPVTSHPIRMNQNSPKITFTYMSPTQSLRNKSQEYFDKNSINYPYFPNQTNHSIHQHKNRCQKLQKGKEIYKDYFHVKPANLLNKDELNSVNEYYHMKSNPGLPKNALNQQKRNIPIKNSGFLQRVSRKEGIFVTTAKNNKVPQ